MKKRRIRRRTNLTDDERKTIADSIRNGAHIKQIAAAWKVSPGYVYLIVNEFLEWRLEWKMKE